MGTLLSRQAGPSVVATLVPPLNFHAQSHALGMVVLISTNALSEGVPPPCSGWTHHMYIINFRTLQVSSNAIAEEDWDEQCRFCSLQCALDARKES